MKALAAFAVGAVTAATLVWLFAPRVEKDVAEINRTPTLEVVREGPATALDPPRIANAPAAVNPPDRPAPRAAKLRPFRPPVARNVAFQPAELPLPPVLETEPGMPFDGGWTAPASLGELPPPPQPNRVTIEAGTVIHVILEEDLSSKKNLPGDVFSASLDRELIAGGFVIAEPGSRVEGRVVEAGEGGRVKGRASLALQLTRFWSADGQEVAISTDSFIMHAGREGMKDAAKVGAAASIGALIGAIAGGGRGAAIGAAAGGAAGAGAVLGTRGGPAELRAETRIPFRLNAPVALTEGAR